MPLNYYQALLLATPTYAEQATAKQCGVDVSTVYRARREMEQVL
jgi:hypothetical protein